MEHSKTVARTLASPALKGTTRLAAVALLVAGMGIAMPSCPGQKEMQTQLDDLTKKNADLNRRVVAMETQMKDMKGKLSSEIEPLLATTAKTVLEHKDIIAKLNESVENLKSRPAPKAAAASKKAPAKKGGKRH